MISFTVMLRRSAGNDRKFSLGSGRRERSGGAQGAQGVTQIGGSDCGEPLDRLVKFDGRDRGLTGARLRFVAHVIH